MLITNHVLSGAVVGLIAPGPGTAATGGFASHFLLDAVPHFGVDEEHLMRIAVPDGLLGLACIGAVLAATPGRQRLPVAAASPARASPTWTSPAGSSSIARRSRPGSTASTTGSSARLCTAGPSS